MRQQRGLQGAIVTAIVVKAWAEVVNEWVWVTANKITRPVIVLFRHHSVIKVNC